MAEIYEGPPQKTPLELLSPDSTWSFSSGLEPMRGGFSPGKKTLWVEKALSQSSFWIMMNVLSNRPIALLSMSFATSTLHTIGGTKTPASIVIVGAGWSGLSAGIILSQAGHRVRLLECAPQAGGRARQIRARLASASLHSSASLDMVDNGQHLCVGQYRTLFSLLQIIDPTGVQDAFECRPFYWPLPREHALLDAYYLAKLAFFLLRHSQPSLLAAYDKKPLSTFAREQSYSPAFCQGILERLCLAIFSTPWTDTSAGRFLCLLKELLSPSARRLYFPRKNLTALFVEPALHFIQKHGGEFLPHHRVSALLEESSSIRGVICTKQIYHADHTLLATPAWETQALIHRLDPRPDSALWFLEQKLRHYRPQMIMTVYLLYPETLRYPREYGACPHPLFHTLWIFDRRIVDQPGLFALIITPPHAQAQDRLDDMSHAELIAECEQTLYTHMMSMQSAEQPCCPPKALGAKVIREKKAAFAVHPALPTLPSVAPLPGLWLCGDYMHPIYPATLESALISGTQTAQALLDTLSFLPSQDIQ